MFTDENNVNLWDFEVKPNVTFLNCNRVHPLKQLEIQKLCDSCITDSQIQELIVFGSSVNFNCNSRSDIDIVVIRQDGLAKVPDEFFAINSELDIIFSVGERLKKILYETGVSVYRR